MLQARHQVSMNSKVLDKDSVLAEKALLWACGSPVVIARQHLEARWANSYTSKAQSP